MSESLSILGRHDAFPEIPLKHRLLAVLALAASKGYGRVPLMKFQGIFADLAESFPGVFPDLGFNRTPNYAHSKMLDGALQSMIGSGVDITMPGRPDILISPAAADHFVGRLKQNYGDPAIDGLLPVADELIRKLTEGTQVP